MTAPAPATVRAVVTPESGGDYSVKFALSNETDQPIDVAAYYPFLQFELQATADGAALSVVQPPYDIPLQKRSVTVPARGSVDLPSPIKLHFGEPASKERFVWSIAHAPKGVALSFALKLPSPFDQRASVTL